MQFTKIFCAIFMVFFGAVVATPTFNSGSVCSTSTNTGGSRVWTCCNANNKPLTGLGLNVLGLDAVVQCGANLCNSNIPILSNIGSSNSYCCESQNISGFSLVNFQASCNKVL